MWKPLIAIASSLALSSALLIGAPAPDGGGARPFVNGHGEWETGIGTVGFQVTVRELADGTFQGHGVSYLHSAQGNSWFHFDVIDATYFGDEVAVLGLITNTFNTPPQFLDSLTTLLVDDNGQGRFDTALSASGLPTFLTLDDILYGPMPPPPFRFPLAHGNFRVH